MLLNLYIAFSQKQEIDKMQKLSKQIKEILQKNNITSKIKRVPLQGLFFAEPLLKIESDDKYFKCYKNVSKENIESILIDFIRKKYNSSFLLQDDDSTLFCKKDQILIQKFSKNYRNFSDYFGNNGFKAISEIIKSNEKELLLNNIKLSKLRERDHDADFFFEKLQNNGYPIKTIVCNMYDDLNLLKNDVVIDTNPYKILEGLLITAFVTGAKEGIIFIKANMKDAIETLQNSIVVLKEKNLLGKRILNSNFDFDIHIRKGFGSLLFSSKHFLSEHLINENNGFKKIYIPHLENEKKGMLISDAETFMTLAYIVNNGIKEFQSYGLKNSYGTKLISLLGNINQKGVFEITLGIKIKDIIKVYGKGSTEKTIKAIQVGGIQGTIIPYKFSKTNYDFDYLKEIGISIGNGDIYVMGQNVCMVDYTKYIANIFQRECCGKCAIGRIGLKRISEILIRITHGEGIEDDIRVLKKLIDHLRTLSMCEFGKRSSLALNSAITYFENEFYDHIKKKKCTAKQCENLVTYQIKKDKCNNCKVCAEKCPVNAITKNTKGNFVIDNELCIKCNLCYEICNQDAIEKFSKGI